MVIVFVLVWVLLGLGVFFVAMRGGPRGARRALHTESNASRRLVTLGVVVLFAAGLAVPALVLAFNGNDKASVGAGGGTCTASGSGNINGSVNLPSGGSVTYTASCAISVYWSTSF